MVNTQWLEQHISQINFHCPKDGRDIEVLLYYIEVLLLANCVNSNQAPRYFFGNAPHIDYLLKRNVRGVILLREINALSVAGNSVPCLKPTAISGSKSYNFHACISTAMPPQQSA